MPSASYLNRRFPVGTKYVIERCGPFVQRHVELPNGHRIRLSKRKALTYTRAERQTNIVPEQVIDALDDGKTFRRRIFA
jgi:hypothetical protein